jgi:hypothetical protein
MLGFAGSSWAARIPQVRDGLALGKPVMARFHAGFSVGTVAALPALAVCLAGALRPLPEAR